MSYPRPVCYVPLRSLREKNLIAKVTEGGKDSNIPDLRISTDYVRLKTFGDIRTDYKKFKAHGSDKKKHGPLIHSTINEPLFIYSYDVTIIEKCPPGELHMLCGFFNHIFWDGLVPHIGRQQALEQPFFLKSKVQKLSW